MKYTLTGRIPDRYLRQESQQLAAVIVLNLRYAREVNQDHGIREFWLYTEKSDPQKWNIRHEFSYGYFEELQMIKSIRRDGKDLPEQLLKKVDFQIRDLLADVAMEFLFHQEETYEMTEDEFLSHYLEYSIDEKLPYLLFLYTGKKDEDLMMEEYGYEYSVNYPAVKYLFKEVISDIRAYQKLIQKVGDRIFQYVEFDRKATAELIEWIEKQLISSNKKYNYI